MKMIKHSAVTASLFALCYWAYFDPIKHVQNIWAFLTWFTLVAVILGFTKPARDAAMKTHAENKHAPAWFDFWTYAPVILCCAAFGDFGKAAIWAAMASMDFSHRYAYEAQQKSKQENTNKQTP